jgi:hypothetical protein
MSECLHFLCNFFIKLIDIGILIKNYLRDLTALLSNWKIVYVKLNTV